MRVRFTTIVGIVLACLAVLAAVMIGSIKALGTAEEYEKVLKSHMRAILGRDVTIDGSFEIRSDLPPRLVMTNVALANPSGSSHSDMIRIGRLEAEADLIALLFHQLKIRRMTVSDVDLFLERDKNGKANWGFSPVTVPLEPNTTASSTDDLPPFPDLLGLRAMNVRNLRVLWSDGQERRQEAFFDEIFFRATDSISPISVVARGTRGDSPFRVSGTVGEMDALVRVLDQGGRYSVQMRSQSQGMTAVVLGVVEAKPAEATRFTAELKMNGTDVSDLDRSLGGDFPFQGFFDISGTLTVSSDGITLHKADAAIGLPREENLRYRGRILSLVPLRGMNGRLMLNARSLKKLSVWSGIDFPDLGPVTVPIMISGSGQETRFSVSNGRVGNTLFSLLLDASDNGGVSGKISLPDLRIEEWAKADLHSLQKADIEKRIPQNVNLDVEVARLSYGTLIGQNARASIKRAGGLVAVDPFSLVMDKGAVKGQFVWDEDDKVHFQMQGKGVQTDALLRGDGAFFIEMKAHGSDTSSWLSGVKGDVWGLLENGRFVQEGFFHSLFPTGKNFNCLAAHGSVENGEVRHIAILMDSPETVMGGQGDIKLRENGTFNLILAAHDKGQPAKTTRIVGLRGDLSHPEIIPMSYVPAMVPVMSSTEDGVLSPCVKGVARKRSLDAIPSIFHKAAAPGHHPE